MFCLGTVKMIDTLLLIRWHHSGGDGGLHRRLQRDVRAKEGKKAPKPEFFSACPKLSLFFKLPGLFFYFVVA
jgi:hypothetical protein